MKTTRFSQADLGNESYLHSYAKNHVLRCSLCDRMCDALKERRREVDMLHNLRFPRFGRAIFPKLFPSKYSFLLHDH
jgi:hypothetical protein